jgi:hypothetical protein
LTKIIGGILFFISFVLITQASAKSSQPLPICTSIKSFQAYEMAKAVKDRCDPQGVSMSVDDLQRTFLPMLTDEFASVSGCNADCMLLGVTNGTSIEDCVKNSIVGPFVEAMMSSGEYNRATCEDMKSRI